MFEEAIEAGAQRRAQTIFSGDKKRASLSYRGLNTNPPKVGGVG